METLPAPGTETVRTAQPGTTVARGQQLSRYVVLQEIGRGAMGVVYAAYDPKLDRKVALKALLGGDATRLLREAQALARLTHSNVVAVHDVGVDDGRVFIAMEFIDGCTLEDWLEQTSRDWTEIVDVFIAAGRGLAAAHAARIVHRDFKPANAMMTRAGLVKVTDFGLARDSGDSTRHTDDGPDGEFPHASAELDIQLTEPGAMVGTPLYMSPEQHGGDRATEASDQFSFCSSLYQALYRQRPVDAEDLPSLRASVLMGELRPPPTTTNAPAALGRIVMRGMSVKRHERFTSMDALVAELVRLRARRQRRLVTAGAVVVGGALVVAAGLRASAPGPCDGADRLPAWDLQTREQVVDSFASVDGHHATLAIDTVLPAIDHYVARWGELRHQACVTAQTATVRTEPPVELRIACLERRRDAVTVAIEVMAEADQEVVAGAAHLVEQLPALQLCNDPDVALLDAQPRTADKRTAVARLRLRLERAKAQRTYGESESSLHQATALLDDALALGFAPFIAEVRLARSAAMDDLGQEREAADEVEAAYIAATTSGARLLAANATALLIVLYGEIIGETDRAKTWARIGRGWLPHLADQPALAAQIESSLALHASVQRDLDEAIERARRAVTLAQDSNSPEVLSRAQTNLGVVYNRAGRLSEAIELLEAVRVDVATRLGEDHPETADMWVRLAGVYEMVGRYQECLEASERAVEIRERHSYDAMHLGQALMGLAAAHASLHRVDQARAAALRSMAQLDRVIEGDHRLVAIGLNNLGNYADELGRLEESIQYYEQAIAMRRRLSTDPGDLIAPLTNLGTAYTNGRKFERGLEILEEAWALAQAELPGAHPTRAFVQAVLGDTYRKMDRNEQAHRHLSESIVLLQAKLDPRASIIVTSLVSLGQVQRKRGEPERAVATLQQALAVDDLSHHGRANALQHLAEAQWDVGQRQGARASVTEAITSHGEHLEADDLAQLQQWLHDHGG